MGTVFSVSENAQQQPIVSGTITNTLNATEIRELDNNKNFTETFISEEGINIDDTNNMNNTNKKIKSILKYMKQLFYKLPIKVDEVGNTYYEITNVYYKLQNYYLNTEFNIDFKNILIQEYLINYPLSEPQIIMKDTNNNTCSEVRFYCKTDKRKTKNINNKIRNKIHKIKYKIGKILKINNNSNNIIVNDNFIQE
jgi:hypothetical protein